MNDLNELANQIAYRKAKLINDAIRKILIECKDFPQSIVRDVDKHGIRCHNFSKAYIRKYTVHTVSPTSGIHTIKFKGKIIGIFKPTL